MKIRSYLLSLLAIQVLTLPLLAGDIKEADYPTQYEVMNTSKSQTLVVEKFCSMTLRDKSKPNIAINVQKKGYGSCKVLDSGKVFQGRQNEKKNEIELVIVDEKNKDKARVEDWQIVGTVNITPTANPN